MHLFLLLLITALGTMNAGNRGDKYVMGFWPGGMGVCINSTLNHLAYCDANNKTPVVYWGPTCLYAHPHGFNGQRNVWRYYFNPVSSLDYRPGDTINHFCQGNGCGSFSYGNMAPAVRNRAYQLIQKYISPNSIVQNKIDSFYAQNMAGKKTIGIHLRGTDKVVEEKPISPQSIIAEALKYADDNTQFFIATDEQKLFDEMMQLLAGKKVISYDCYRSENGAPLHLPTRRNKPSFAQLGEDVIVEMLLLSKCDMFIHTASNVSSIPLYFNPELPHVLLRLD